MYVFLFCAGYDDLTQMSSTADVGQSSDNIIESKGSDRVDRFDMTGVNQDKELI